MDFRDNTQKCQEYIQALEEERHKIQVFQRELPLCLELVTQAIEACKQQLSGTSATEYFNGHSECSERTASDGPIFEEFIPIKRSNSTDDDDDNELESNKPQVDYKNNSNNKSGKKSDWLRSVQLWNQTPDPPTPTQEKVSIVEVKKSGGAFKPFQKEKSSSINKPTSVHAASARSSTVAKAAGGDKKEETGGHSQRKTRRCWSPELHRRFLHALQQLGGSHVATPKQIRELMKVDGLTNDEVKSHLQKYRLHARRPTQAIHKTANPQAPPQLVVVGGIWMPTPEYTAVAATTTSGDTTTVATPNPNGIYASVPAVSAPPPPHQASMTVSQDQEQKQSSQSHSKDRGCQSYGGVHPNSPATSSSTHTTTASHSC